MTEKSMSQTTVDALVAERLNLSLPLERKKVDRKQMELLQATIEHARSNSSLYKKRFSHLQL